MKKVIGIFLFFICLLPILQAQSETKDSTYILLKNALIIDGISENAQKGDLLIKNQQIEQVGYQEAIIAPKNSIISVSYTHLTLPTKA